MSKTKPSSIKKITAPVSATNPALAGTFKKESMTDFKVFDCGGMSAPEMKQLDLRDAIRNKDEVYVKASFTHRDGTGRILPISPEFLPILARDPVYLSSLGSVCYFVMTQRILGKKDDYAAVPLTSTQGTECVSRVVCLPRHEVPHREVGDDALREGAELLIMEVDIDIGLATPMSVPHIVSKTKREALIAKAVLEMSEATEISIGQRFANAFVVNSFEPKAGGAKSMVVKFKPMPTSETRDA